MLPPRHKKVIFLAICLNFLAGEVSLQALTSAISSLIERAVLQGRPTKLDLVYFGSYTKLVDKVLRTLPETASVTITDGMKNEANQLNVSTLLLFDSSQ